MAVVPPMRAWCRVWGYGFRVQSLGFVVQGSGFVVQGSYLGFGSPRRASRALPDKGGTSPSPRTSLLRYSRVKVDDGGEQCRDTKSNPPHSGVEGMGKRV